MKSLTKHIHVQYYAIFREERGLSQETVTTVAQTPHELYLQLQSQLHFTFPSELLRYAVNQTFVDGSVELKDGDHVIFIPPVSGG